MPLFDVPPTPESLAFRDAILDEVAKRVRALYRREELALRIHVGAELLDWAEMNIPEEMP